MENIENDKDRKENEILSMLNDDELALYSLNSKFIEPFQDLNSAYEQNPKYFTKYAEKQLFKKYKNLIKVISFNDKWKTKQNIKQKKQLRKEIKQTINFMLKRKRLRLQMEELNLKHEQLPKKIEFLKSSISYERKFWSYVGLKIKTFFIEWFKPEPKDDDKKND